MSELIDDRDIIEDISLGKEVVGFTLPIRRRGRQVLTMDFQAMFKPFNRLKYMDYFPRTTYSTVGAGLMVTYPGIILLDTVSCQ